MTLALLENILVLFGISIFSDDDFHVQVDERLRNQIETLTKSLNEAYEKINDFQATNKLIELNVGEEMCKVPLNNVTSQCRGGKKHGNLSSDS